MKDETYVNISYKELLRLYKDSIELQYLKEQIVDYDWHKKFLDEWCINKGYGSLKDMEVEAELDDSNIIQKMKTL